MVAFKNSTLMSKIMIGAAILGGAFMFYPVSQASSVKFEQGRIVYMDSDVKIKEVCLNGIVNTIVVPQQEHQGPASKLTLMLPAFKEGGIGPIDVVPCKV